MKPQDRYGCYLGRIMKTALIIKSDAFHLGWMGATRRIFGLAQGFRGLGYEMVLLAGPHTNSGVQADVDRAFPGEVIRTVHTGDYPRLLDVAPLPRRAWRAGWKARGADHYWSRLSWGWADRLDLNWLRRELGGRGIRPAFVWGVSTSFLDGAVAAARIADAYSLPWVFELQDPPRCAGQGVDRVRIVEKFHDLLKGSSVIVVTTESYRRVLLQKFHVPPEKVHTIHLTFDESSRKSPDAPAADGIFRIVYAGSMEDGRSMVPVMRGLGLAFERTDEMRTAVLLELAGKGSGFEEAISTAKSLSLSESVRYLGYMDGTAVQAALQQRADALVVTQTMQTAIQQIPGKIFESFVLKRPILGVMPPDCEAADILRRSGFGRVHGEDDAEGIAQTLTELWCDWRKGQPSINPDNDYISRFSSVRLPGKLKRVLEAIGRP
jgi:glycosyltransferase involved in cell wall biosynthesis